jgi:hypothetical protein
MLVSDALATHALAKHTKVLNCDGGRNRKGACGTFQGRYNNKRETGILVHDEAMPAGQRPHLGKVADPLGCKLTGRSPCFTFYIPWRHAGQGARRSYHPGKGRSGGACRPAHHRASWWANVAKLPAAARSPACQDGADCACSFGSGGSDHDNSHQASSCRG